MEITEIITQLKQKFGDNIDVTKIKEMFKDKDTSKFSMQEIIEKVKSGNLVGDLDGDGKVESTFEEIKGKASDMLGGIFGGKK